MPCDEAVDGVDESVCLLHGTPGRHFIDPRERIIVACFPFVFQIGQRTRPLAIELPRLDQEQPKERENIVVCLGLLTLSQQRGLGRMERGIVCP